MASLKGNVSDLKSLGRRLTSFPTTLVHAVAGQTAPALTIAATSAHAARRSVYGESYGESTATGKPLTLDRTGLAASTIRFIATGSVVRCVLGPSYSRFLIGRYRILPMGRMPAEWADKIRQIVSKSQVAL